MSTEYIAVIVTALSFALKYFKIEIGTDDLTSFVTAVGTVCSLGYLLYKRYMRGGITPLGMRKA